MSAAHSVRGHDVVRHRARVASSHYAPVVARARLELCSVAESDCVRGSHLAALLAWTDSARRVDAGLEIEFAHRPTALWVSEVLGVGGDVIVRWDAGADVVQIRNPQTVLGRYGYRDGRWLFGSGLEAWLGIARGAVHASGVFDRYGLRVDCPTEAMKLTVTGLLGRLGIAAEPASGQPCALIRHNDVRDAMARLGIAGAASMYRSARATHTTVNGKASRS